MSQQHSVPSSALLWGSIFGGLVVVLDLVDRFLIGGVDRLAPAIAAVLRRQHLVAVRTTNPGRIFLVEGIVLLITVSLFFLAGALAARRASEIEAGIGAGVLAGAIVGVAHMLVVVLVIPLAAHPAVIAEIVRGLVIAISAVVLGVAMGALGGLIGRVTPSIQSPSEQTPPTPYHYGPQNDYPTAPLETPSHF